MRKRRPIELFSLSFLDLISGALGAVIILYVAIPKTKPTDTPKKDDILVKALQIQAAESRKTIEDLQKELAETKAKIAAPVIAPTVTPTTEATGGGLDADIGFKFKGKNIVFIIDTSYSMIEEDRMGQVKAGLKMLLTSLPAEYRVDVVQFPLGERAPFRSMWGVLKDFKGIHRTDAFDFIYSLRPLGGTPTRDTLLFVLDNYEGVSDIVLLSDGAPTYHNSNKKDDIYEILRLARESNKTKKIQINTIGVGSKFVHDQTSEQFKFLSLLASEHKGFFVGF